MKYLFYFIIPSLTMMACCKEDINMCTSDISMEYSRNTFFGNYYCANNEFRKVYYSIDEFENDPDCQIATDLITPLNFDGIIVAQGVEVPYFNNPNTGNSHDLSVELEQDICEKHLKFKFILETIDTSSRGSIIKSAYTVLDGIDSSYQIEFSSDVIPYKGE